jgi:hypothetical protein
MEAGSASEISVNCQTTQRSNLEDSQLSVWNLSAVVDLHRVWAGQRLHTDIDRKRRKLLAASLQDSASRKGEWFSNTTDRGENYSH